MERIYIIVANSNESGEVVYYVKNFEDACTMCSLLNEKYNDNKVYSILPRKITSLNRFRREREKKM